MSSEAGAVTITGADGFIGRNLRLRLAEHGRAAIPIARSPGLPLTTLRCYGTGPWSCLIYEDDGQSFRYETGQFGLFSRLFMNYDFYAFGGPGFIDFKSDDPCDQPVNNRSCAVTGFKIGANFGLGMHLFANDFFALNFELRDILLQNNPAGRDTNGDQLADDRDLSWDSNYIMSLNLMFFLPGRATISP